MSEVVRFEFQKLVRDKVLDGMQSTEAVPKVEFLRGTRLEAALLNKLEEELLEVHDDEGDVFEEIGDVLEVVRALENMDELSDNAVEKLEEVRKKVSEIIELNDWDNKAIESAHVEKFRDKGNYSLGAFVEHVDVRDDDPWFSHLKSNPDKYPVIDNK